MLYEVIPPRRCPCYFADTFDWLCVVCAKAGRAIHDAEFKKRPSATCDPFRLKILHRSHLGRIRGIESAVVQAPSATRQAMSINAAFLRLVALASSLTLLVGYVVYSHRVPASEPETSAIAIIGTKAINQPIFSVRDHPVEAPAKPFESPTMFDSSKSGRIRLPAWSVDLDQVIAPFDLFHSKAPARPEP